MLTSTTLSVLFFNRSFRPEFYRLAYTQYVLDFIFIYHPIMKKNVLLFEKQGNLRRLYEAMLSKDFHVTAATTPHEILARVKMGQIPEAIVANLRNEVFEDTEAFLQLYQHTGYIARIPLFLIAPAQAGRFEATLTETPLFMVSDATLLASTIRNFFMNAAIAPIKQEKGFWPEMVPVSLS